MATITSPTIAWTTPTVKPQAQGEIVLAAEIMEGGPPAIFTRPVLVSPAFNQLLNDPGVGYPL